MCVLITPDKFKISLSALEAAQALAAGWDAAWPKPPGPQALDILPIAEGCEGTKQAVQDALDGEWATRTGADPLETSC